MNGIFLPEVDFDDDVIPNNNSKSMKSDKSVKSVKDLKIDKINKNDKNSKKIDKVDKFEKTDKSDKIKKKEDLKIKKQMKAPVYDGVEPYYKFQRRWTEYIASLGDDMDDLGLQFLNEAFNTSFTSITSVRGIKQNQIPTIQTLIDMFEGTDDYKKKFKIRCNKNMEPLNVINNLLKKINYSFIKTNQGYRTRPIISSDDNAMYTDSKI